MYTMLAYGLGTLILIIIGLKLFRTKQHHKAASNVLFAKYTFESLQKNKQKLIKNRAKELVLASQTKLRGFANEVERYSWYAVAMDDLGIKSAVPDNPAWHKVKNPYSAIIPGNYLLKAVSTSLLTQYGINVSVSEAKNYGAINSNDVKNAK